MLKKHFHLFTGSKIYYKLVYRYNNLLVQETWNGKFLLLTKSFKLTRYLD